VKRLTLTEPPDVDERAMDKPYVPDKFRKWPSQNADATASLTNGRRMSKSLGQNLLQRGRLPRLLVLAAMASGIGLPAAALADVPHELLGRWSTDPVRCQQANGEVDVLEVTPSGFELYEIGCALMQAARSSGAIRFVARCYKGGSPTTIGTVVMRRLSPDKIDVALLGFAWTSEKPETFQRCRSSR
jgi:hypothetical protein